MSKKLPKRELLQQAHTYSEDKHRVAGWYVSEKLDGVRAWWDGGLTRGMMTHDIPWASKTVVKSGKEKPNVEATGLWSRYGNPIFAPDEFLNQLPCCVLDGELYLGRGNFQKVSSVVRKNEPGPEWADIDYVIFGSPNLYVLFQDGHCRDGKNIDMVIDHDEIQKWVMENVNPEIIADFVTVDGNFIHELEFLAQALNGSEGQVALLTQRQLPADEEMAKREIDQMMETIIADGGEGVMVRNPNKVWEPKRSHHILKVKNCLDDEAVIVGFRTGEETDKGSKYLGKIGSLIVERDGVRFYVSGLTDEEREFKSSSMTEWARENPRTDVGGDALEGEYFKSGDTITFKYMELTDDGVPRSPRYFRKRELV